MERKNILLLTMVISPTLGSEYSVAWNHVKFMSKHHNLHVLYASSSNILGDASEMKRYLKENKLENVTFHHVKPGKVSNFIFKTTKKVWGFKYLRYFTYLSYSFWHRDTHKFAQGLVKEQNFDLVHFLGPIGYREPGKLWKLDIPYMRGPVGGTYQKPRVLFKALNTKERFLFNLRNAFNWLQFRLSRGLRKSLEQTNLLLTTTSRVQSDFLKIHKKESRLLPENSISKIYGLDNSKFASIDKQVELIWVGRIDGNKALILLLEALSRINNKNYCLHVVGRDSNMSTTCRSFVKNMNLVENVKFHGVVPREKVYSMMNSSHLHVISSLSEGHPTTQWEAMSVGLPTLTLDHCGMADVINENSGIKIPITTYDGTIEAMADSLQMILDKPQILVDLANKTIKEAENFSWEKRVDYFNKLYSKF